MTQVCPATCVLGPGKTGLAIGYRVLNLDGTTYSAFSITDVAETSVLGTYRKASGVVAPNAGGYIVWGTAVLDLAEATVDSDVINSVSGSVGGDVEGKVLGGGAGVFVADGVQVAASAGGLTAQETANAVNNLAPVGVAAVGSIGANLDSILNGLTGVGLIPLVYTVTELGGVVPIPSVTVELYTEEACLNCVRRGLTNSFGVVTFWMSTAGTYWIKSAKDGYSFELDSETVAV